MKAGLKATEKLESEYPNCHRFFGTHKSSEHFFLVLYGSDWVVVEDEGCWILVDDQYDNSGEVHWFCPEGMKITSIRKMLNFLFEHHFTKLYGSTPTHLTAAKVLNRAVGAVKDGDSYSLTRDQFLAYNGQAI